MTCLIFLLQSYSFPGYAWALPAHRISVRAYRLSVRGCPAHAVTVYRGLVVAMRGRCVTFSARRSQRLKFVVDKSFCKCRISDFIPFQPRARHHKVLFRPNSPQCPICGLVAIPPLPDSQQKNATVSRSREPPGRSPPKPVDGFVRVSTKWLLPWRGCLGDRS
jgi:hypothetical protein